MGSSSPEWRSYFATIADSYDRLQPVLSPPYSRGLDMIVDLIPFGANDAFEFVDLGCGTAEPTVHVLEHFRHATGTCIDSEPEMLALARRKLTSYSDRIEVREADITSCDIQPCDVVFSAKTIHHVPPAVCPNFLPGLQAHSGRVVASSFMMRCRSGPGGGQAFGSRRRASASVIFKTQLLQE